VPMLETKHYPESFDEMVELVLAGQKAAAGSLWDGTLQRLPEDVAEERQSLTSERD